MYGAHFGADGDDPVCDVFGYHQGTGNSHCDWRCDRVSSSDRSGSDGSCGDNPRSLVREAHFRPESKAGSCLETRQMLVSDLRYGHAYFRGVADA